MSDFKTTDATVSPSTDLAISKAAENRDLVLSVLGDAAYQDIDLGDTPIDTLVKWMGEFDLKSDDVEQMLALRRDHKAGLPMVAKKLREGWTLDQVETAYETQTAVKDNHAADIGTPSLDALRRFAEAFHLTDLDPDEIANKLAWAHRRLRKRTRGRLHYLNETLALLMLDLGDNESIDSTFEAFVQTMPVNVIPKPQEDEDPDPTESLGDDFAGDELD